MNTELSLNGYDGLEERPAKSKGVPENHRSGLVGGWARPPPTSNLKSLKRLLAQNIARPEYYAVKNVMGKARLVGGRFHAGQRILFAAALLVSGISSAHAAGYHGHHYRHHHFPFRHHYGHHHSHGWGYRPGVSFYYSPGPFYGSGYYPSYGYDYSYAYPRANYAVGGTLLGALAGGLIGHGVNHQGWEGAGIGAAAGLVLGGIAEHRTRARERAAYYGAQTTYAQPNSVANAPTVSNAPTAPAAPTLSNTPAPRAAAPRPMSSANSLFGR